MPISPIVANTPRPIAFKKSNTTPPEVKKENHHHKADKNVILSTLAGTAIGIAAAVSLITMIQKGKKAKEGEIIKFLNQLLINKYEEKEVIALGGASILGGLTGGVLSDKKETHKAKLREAMLQFFGNFVVPVSMLAGVKKALENTPLFKEKSKEMLEKVAKETKGLPIKILAGRAAVVIGTLLIGTKIGNYIMKHVNNAVFKEEKKRDMCLKDLSASVDDMCYSLPFIADTGFIRTTVSKVLPFIFLIPGYETGTRQH